MICHKPEWKNRCCCNCQHSVTIVKHPWNSGIAKGSIKDILGYGCSANEKGNIIFFDVDTENEGHHGLCEMHTTRDESNGN